MAVAARWPAEPEIEWSDPQRVVWKDMHQPESGWFQNGTRMQRAIGLATLRLDGFVSLKASGRGGELLTKPLTFAGRQLVLNFSTGAAGSVRVEIRDSDGKPLPGYSLRDAVDATGDEIARVVMWKADGDVGALAGKPVRLRVVAKDADIYSLQFTQ